MQEIIVAGPKDAAGIPSDAVVIRLNGSTRQPWAKDLCPRHLGPVQVGASHVCKIMENAWAYAHVCASHVDIDGDPTEEYRAWAEAGWTAPIAHDIDRSPADKVQYVYWAGRQYSQADARLEVFFPLYRDAVKTTGAFARLQQLARSTPIVLWDADGFQLQQRDMSLADVFQDSAIPLSPAFILKAMLEFGADVTPDDVIGANRAASNAPVHEVTMV